MDNTQDIVVKIDENISVEDNLDKEPTKGSSGLLVTDEYETVKSA